jgi:predicted DsbA family dithiol-disulfide isomerase
MEHIERIRFHFDPRCPWCYQTSRWARRLDELGEVAVDWGVFSLEVVNLPDGEDPRGLDAKSGPMLRTSMVIAERVDRRAVGAFYAAVGRRVWESAPPDAIDDLAVLRAALTEAGLQPELLDEALADPKTWDAVVDEHQALVERTKTFGVPTIVLDGGEGPAIFGPVVSTLPDDDDAVELWRHTAWLVRYGNFAELKRGRVQPPDLPALRWR